MMDAKSFLQQSTPKPVKTFRTLEGDIRMATYGPISDFNLFYTMFYI